MIIGCSYRSYQRKSCPAIQEQLVAQRAYRSLAKWDDSVRSNGIMSAAVTAAARTTIDTVRLIHRLTANCWPNWLHKARSYPINVSGTIYQISLENEWVMWWIFGRNEFIRGAGKIEYRCGVFSGREKILTKCLWNDWFKSNMGYNLPATTKSSRTWHLKTLDYPLPIAHCPFEYEWVGRPI